MNLITTHFDKKIVRLLRLIGERADAMGDKAFIVGGTVRDLMLGARHLDLDVVVEGPPARDGGIRRAGDAILFGERLAEELQATLKTHKMFGTCTLGTKDKLKIDFATARKEIYAHPAALPTVEFGSLKDDLNRRDFTINAMAVSLNEDSFGRLIDLFGGERDLGKGIIRVMHEASFIDDPTRIFRAVRFEQRLKFSIETKTLKLLKAAIKKGMLSKLSKYRIKKELGLILKEESKHKILERLEEIGAGIIRPDKL